MSAAGPRGGIGLYVNGPRGPVLGGAWAYGPSALAPSLHPFAGGWLFGASPEAPVAGLSASGAVIVALKLYPQAPPPEPRAEPRGPQEPQLGAQPVPGTGALRELMACADLPAMRAWIESRALSDGRCWMLSDGETFLGFEQLGAERILTRVGPKTGHVHVNHCFDPSLRQRERQPRDPESYRRLDLASTLYVQRRPDTVATVVEYFDAVEEAAFPVGARAQARFAVELGSRRISWRGGADDPLVTQASP